MQFPEELDDRVFRLFVQRTCYFITKSLALSSTEKELADLIRAFPELGFMSKVDVDARYSSAEVNPFMLLESLRQAQHQLAVDRPKGINQVVTEITGSQKVNRETLLTLAEIYLASYLSCKSAGGVISDNEYLLNVQELLSDPEGIAFEGDLQISEEQEERTDLISKSMMQEMIAEYHQAMHEQASSKDISPNSKAKSLFNKLPIEWVDAAAEFWQIAPLPLKRERIAALIDFLGNEKMKSRIRKNLKKDEIEALAFVLAEDGWVKYGTLKKRFGEEHEDGYWWCSNPPRSVIGRLRMKGLLFVGRTVIDSQRYKAAVIPKEFRSLIADLIT